MRGVVTSLTHKPHDMNGDTFTFTLSTLRPSQFLSLFGIEKHSLSRSKKDCVRNEECVANIHRPVDGWIEPVETCQKLVEE
jgi:hypothetical protein